jgi:ribosome maturation factor RimP
MQETLNKIKEIIEKPMEELNIIVCDIDYVTENNYHFLKIVLDKANGIDLDTIVEATNIINPLLDKYDLIKEEYILDISSKERD